MDKIVYYIGIIIGFVFVVKVVLYSIINTKKEWLVVYNDKVKSGEDSPSNILRISSINLVIEKFSEVIKKLSNAIIFGNLVIVVSLVCQYFSLPSYSVDGLFYIFIIRVGYLAYITNSLLNKNSSVK